MVQVYIACHWGVGGLLLQLPVRVEMPQNLLSRLKGNKPTSDLKSNQIEPKNYEYIACHWWMGVLLQLPVRGGDATELCCQGP